MDRQELLADGKYSLNRYDFQEGYTISPEDDQTSYLEKKMFKFKYRRALDSRADYERKNERMVERQRQRFGDLGYNELISKYLSDPSQYESEYLKMISNESIKQYSDYFESDKEDLDLEFFEANKHKVATVFENWTTERKDKSSYESFPLPKWNNELGLWSNSVALLQEIQNVRSKSFLLDDQKAAESLSASSIQKKDA